MKKNYRPTKKRIYRTLKGHKISLQRIRETTDVWDSYSLRCADNVLWEVKYQNRKPQLIAVYMPIR